MPHFGRNGASESEQLLTAILRDVLGPTPSRQAVKALARRCHRMARAYLYKQDRMDGLRTDVLGDDTGDLALDAIADLFERDEQGRFPELRRYFQGYFEREDTLQQLVSDAKEAEIRSALRQLVWSAVGDWLLEAYRAADRSLSNQIRALKRAAEESAETTLTKRKGKPWVVVEVNKKSSPEAGRLMPIETMEACLAGAVAEATSTGDLLHRAVLALRTYQVYEAAYPVTLLAQAMRGARAQVQSVTEHAGAADDTGRSVLRAGEVETMIEECLEALREEKRSTYIGEDKIDEVTYRAYLRALGDRLRAKFVPREESACTLARRNTEDSTEEETPYDLTHYEALARHLEDLSKETYRAEHRAKFEYLFQEAEDRLTSQLREAVPAADRKESE